MSDIIKNPNRNRSRPIEINKPEYERLGIEPKPGLPSHYASITSMLPKRGPSVGIDTVSEVDGSIFDDNGNSSYKEDSQIIDNNEFLSFGFSNEKELSDVVETGGLIDFDLDVDSKPSVPAIGEYILMISGDIIMFGPLLLIEERVKNILYGEDSDFNSSKVSQEDIVILKRVELQVGVFIKG